MINIPDEILNKTGAKKIVKKDDEPDYTRSQGGGSRNASDGGRGGQGGGYNRGADNRGGGNNRNAEGGTHGGQGTEGLKDEFINPYNFAENLGKKVRTRVRSHREFKGLISGRIKLRLKFESPAIIGDRITKRVPDGSRDSKAFNHLNFFKYRNMLAIPATSLKGMARSVFELVTGSCMFHYNATDFEGFRTTQKANSDIYAGVVESIPTGDRCGNVTLCDKYLVLPEVFEKSGCKDIYNEKLSTTKVFVKLDRSHKRVIEISKTQKPGFEEAFINISGKMETPLIDNITERNFNAIEIIQLNEKISKLKPYHPKLNPNDKIHVSYSRSKQNNGNDPKSSEYIFDISLSHNHVYMGYIFKKQNKKTNQITLVLQPSKKEVAAVRTEKSLSLNHSEVEKYMHVFRHGQRMKEHRTGNSRENKLKLMKGDVIFFSMAGESVTNIIRASLGRIAFCKSVSEIFTDDEIPCYLHNHNKKLHGDDMELCPACQTFGFAEDVRQTGSKKGGNALAGRVYFSHAIIDDPEKKVTLKTAPLKILGSPHPSCTFFYIKTKDGRLSVKKQARCRDIEAMPDYNKDALIRGRKFYVRHEKADFVETNPLNEKQNMYAEYIEGGTFNFDVDFDNLTEYELGALIYSLTLEEGMLNSIGHAKPLGMGDCRITVSGISIDTSERAKTLDVSKWTVSEDHSKFVAAFKKWAEEKTGKKFSEIAAIRSLAAIRSAIGHKAVKYPSKKDLRGEEHGFAWFVDHANYNHTHYSFWPQPLPLAAELNSRKLKK